MLEVQVTLIPHEDCPEPAMPLYASEGAAAADLRAIIPSPLELPPLGRTVIPTGVALALPSPDWVAVVAARSGLGIRHGITLVNGIGVIDSDYRGEISVGLVNLSDTPYTVMPGDRIAQLMIMPVARANFIYTRALPPTERGAGGFGSTGR